MKSFFQKTILSLTLHFLLHFVHLPCFTHVALIEFLTIQVILTLLYIFQQYIYALLLRKLRLSDRK